MSHKVENTLHIPLLLHTLAQQPRALQSLSCLTLGTAACSLALSESTGLPISSPGEDQNPKSQVHFPLHAQGEVSESIGNRGQSAGRRKGRGSPALAAPQPDHPM